MELAKEPKKSGPAFYVLAFARSSSKGQEHEMMRQSKQVREKAMEMVAELNSTIALNDESPTFYVLDAVGIGSAYNENTARDILSPFFPKKVTRNSSGYVRGVTVKAIAIHDWDRLTRNENDFKKMCEDWFYPLGVSIVVTGDLGSITTRLNGLRDLYPKLIPDKPVLKFNPVDDAENGWVEFEKICGIIRAANLESMAKAAYNPNYKVQEDKNFDNDD